MSSTELPKNLTPLMLAAQKNQPSLIRVYLGNGHHADAQDENGATALHFAAGAGHFDPTRLLLKHGADTALKLNTGETAEELALKNGHHTIVRLFEAQQSMGYRPHFFKTAAQFQPLPKKSVVAKTDPLDGCLPYGQNKKK